MGSIAASVVLENPEPVMGFFEDLIERNIAAIKDALPGVAEQAIEDAFLRVIKGNGTGTERIANGPLEIRAGIATYHWKINAEGMVSASLPNWHQFYIAFRFYQPGTNNLVHANGTVSDPGVVSGLQPPVGVTAYSLILLNKGDEAKTVSFQWGADYAPEKYYLQPGEAKSLVLKPIPFTGKPVEPEVTTYWTRKTKSGWASLAEHQIGSLAIGTVQVSGAIEGQTMVDAIPLAILSNSLNAVTNPRGDGVWTV